MPALLRERFLDAHAYTHRANRAANEDAVAVALPWAVLADGVGGHAHGAAAAQTAVRAVLEYAQASDDLKVGSAVLAAHRAVQQLAGDAVAVLRPASTLVVAAVDEEADVARIAHVGDSRAYAVRDGQIAQVTTDHSWLNELSSGLPLTSEQAARHPMRNAVTRVLGQVDPLAADEVQIPLKGLDALVLVSDGVPLHLPDKDMLFLVDNSRFIKGRQCYVQWAAGALVGQAWTRGGRDNASAVVIGFRADPCPSVQR